MGKIRSLAVSLTLVAMLLRGFLPMGWMPDAHGAFIICSVDGAHRSDKSPAKQDHGDMACPFAAAAHLSSPPMAAFLPAPKREAIVERASQTAGLFPVSARNSQHAARAPPFFA